VDGELFWAGWRWLDATTIEVLRFLPTDTAVAHEVDHTDRLRIAHWDDATLRVETADGLLHTATCRAVPDGQGGLRWWVRTDAADALVEQPPRFLPPGAAVPPGGCIAPMPGRITALLVEPGQAVVKGQRLLTLEAMKMEQSVTASHAGTVTDVRVRLGDQVEADAILLVIEADDT
jgi:propionyl-CoA carboxylase alpha chain